MCMIDFVACLGILNQKDGKIPDVYWMFLMFI